MVTLRLVCASANPDKVAEIERLLAGSVELIPRPSDVPDVDENTDTLVGNARLKARAICDATGCAAVADDTGLFVDALPGELGVHTARYASDRPEHASDPYGANRNKILERLRAVGARAESERRAHFLTVVMVVWPDGRELIAEGRCDGVIAPSEQGRRGFGFDPLFAPIDGDGRTFAEMTDDEKNALSHRGRAFANLVAALR
ncbi:MAG: non-canonical purine NTP pyrophosphatase [Acidimicrobiales bacterium mtb01]|nr:non-canonical purine NTP pyrophosphatase [Actinomycetota bacterium]TEX44817.1 MAG: non-canonical purine NTP pyrophosphatase [Acidimicrobiales bacterium mtb01]